MNYLEAIEKLMRDGYTVVETNADADEIEFHLDELTGSPVEWSPEVVIQEYDDNTARIVEVLPDGSLKSGEPLATVYKGKHVFGAKAYSFLREWNGYQVYGDDDDPNVLVIEDMDGNFGRFDAGDRDWEDMEDLLGLVDEDMRHGRIEWN